MVTRYADGMIQTEPIAPEKTSDSSRLETEVSLLDLLVILAKRKRFITRFVLGAVVLAIILSLILPVEYEAKIVLLPPQQSSSLSSSIVGQLGAMGQLMATMASGSFTGFPCTSTLSFGPTRVANSRKRWPLIVTAPSRMSASHARREPNPARARY